MGSQSDWATMRHAAETLDALGIAHDGAIVSAHRTPDRLYALRQGRARRRLQGDHRRRRRRGASAGHDGGADAAAGARRAGRIRRRCRARIRCCRSSRCRPAFRSARWRSARPARSMRRCWPRPCWRSPMTDLADRLDAWRAAQTAAVAERPADERRMSAPLPPGADHRHHRRRPARPHAGDGRRPARLPHRHPRAAGRLPGGAGRQPADHRRPMTTRPRSPNWRDAADVVTYEFENVPVAAAERACRPTCRSIRRRARWRSRRIGSTEKRFLNRLGISTAAFSAVDNDADLAGGAGDASAAAAC